MFRTKRHLCFSVLGNNSRKSPVLNQQHSPNVVSIGVRASAEAHRAVAVEELLKERAAGEPHPAAGVHAPVSVQQQLLKHLNHVTKKKRLVRICLLVSFLLDSADGTVPSCPPPS